MDAALDAIPREAPAEPAATSEALLLKSFLAGRDVPCPDCGYNLRDLPGDRCPECGQQLALRLRLAEPKMAAVLVGLVGLSAGVGFSGLLLLYWVITVWVHNLNGTGDGWVGIDLVGLFVQGLALVLWLRFRTTVRRMPARRRWTLAACCWGLTLLNLVWFSLTVR